MRINRGWSWKKSGCEGWLWQKVGGTVSSIVFLSFLVQVMPNEEEEESEDEEEEEPLAHGGNV